MVSLGVKKIFAQNSASCKLHVILSQHRDKNNRLDTGNHKSNLLNGYDFELILNWWPQTFVMVANEIRRSLSEEPCVGFILWVLK